ncbi:MAG: hypothetical protein WC824_11355 [Bacteroidota bacterium]
MTESYFGVIFAKTAELNAESEFPGGGMNESCSDPGVTNHCSPRQSPNTTMLSIESVSISTPRNGLGFPSQVAASSFPVLPRRTIAQNVPAYGVTGGNYV